MYAYFSINSVEAYTLTFEAVRGGLDGDIALDDIRITQDECPQKDSQCDFEISCHFSQVSIVLLCEYKLLYINVFTCVADKVTEIPIGLVFVRITANIRLPGFRFEQ